MENLLPLGNVISLAKCIVYPTNYNTNVSIDFCDIFPQACVVYIRRSDLKYVFNEQSIAWTECFRQGYIVNCTFRSKGASSISSNDSDFVKCFQLD